MYLSQHAVGWDNIHWLEITDDIFIQYQIKECKNVIDIECEILSTEAEVRRVILGVMMTA